MPEPMLKMNASGLGLLLFLFKLFPSLKQRLKLGVAVFHVCKRIDGFTFNPYFVNQLGTGSISRRPYKPDDLSFLDSILGRHGHLCQISVKGLYSTAMIDSDDVTICI